LRVDRSFSRLLADTEPAVPKVARAQWPQQSTFTFQDP
jgi:hypothetical protein